MNITLSADPELIRAAREAARKQGRSLNDMIREYLKSLSGAGANDDAADELEELWRVESGNSHGRAWSRDDLYEDRVKTKER